MTTPEERAEAAVPHVGVGMPWDATALQAAAALECANSWRSAVVRAVAAALREYGDARAAGEREACAKIAVLKSVSWTEYEDRQSDDYRRGVEEGASAIASAIRARDARRAPRPAEGG
jgi:hypothetical protein